MRWHVIICLDGVSPDYLTPATTPSLDRLNESGWRVVGRSAMPSVTNVNNVSIVTASPPAVHGITTNYYYDRRSGRATYMESAEFVRAPTIFERAAEAGRRSALITAKDKLRTLLERGATEVISSESPPRWLVDSIGPPPPILSVEVNHWLFRAALALCRARPPDLLYLSTTDYAQHKHPPHSEESQANLTTLDALLAQLLDSGPEFDVVITADHGMVAKTRGLDLGRILARAGIAAEAVPIIKDRYVAHHQNLGGAAYVFVADSAQVDDTAAVLLAEQGVESIWTRAEAAAEYQLYPERIGDLFVLATEETVFGDLPSPRGPVCVRSHGGLHTRAVPIIAAGSRVPSEPFAFNYHAAKHVSW